MGLVVLFDLEHEALNVALAVVKALAEQRRKLEAEQTPRSAASASMPDRDPRADSTVSKIVDAVPPLLFVIETAIRDAFRAEAKHERRLTARWVRWLQRLRLLLCDLVHPHEHLFQLRHRKAILRDAEVGFAGVHQIEELAKDPARLERQPEGQLSPDRVQYLRGRDQLREQRLEPRPIDDGRVLEQHSQGVAHSELLLEEERGAAADQSALCHDRNTVAKDVGLVHEI